MRSAVFVVLLLVVPAAPGCRPGRADVNGYLAPSPERKAGEILEQDQPGNKSAPLTQRDPVENPLYKSWAGFKQGTSVVQRAVTEVAGNNAVTTTTTTYTLLDRTDDQVVIEMQAFTKRYDGTETNNPPQQFTNQKWFTLPPGMSKSDFAKPAGQTDQGEETLTLGGKAYKTMWHKSKDRNEAGEVLVQTWTSDEVPGGLVKSITHTPSIGKTTMLELVEVKIP